MKQKLLNVLRLRFIMFVALVCTAFTGVWADDVTFVAGTNASTCSVNNYDGIKVGTSRVGGDMTITVPANTTKLYLHAAAWKGVTGLSLDISGATASPTSISLTADDGISNNSPFTLVGDEKDFLFEVALSGITTETNIKFTSSISKRFVVWDASAVVNNTDDPRADPNLAFSVTEAEASVGQEFTPPTLTFGEGFNGTVEYESSNTLVAQVMDTETGELRIVSGGTTTITATFEGDENFKSGSASYILNVSDNRIATSISMDDIRLELADIASLTKLVPVVKDADGNEIEYTYGEWPTEVSFEFDFENDPNGIIGSLDNNSGEITLNRAVGTATLKAYYNKYGVNGTYRPSVCTFTITVYQPLNGIGEFCALANNTIGTVKLTDAVVLYANGKDMFVRDATGAIDFYNTGLTYSPGDVLNGKITAKFTLYSNMAELTTPITDNTLVATAGSDVEAVEISTSEASNYACNLVKLTGVTVTSNSNKFYVDDVQVYDKFRVGYSITAGKAYDIVGIMVPYNSIYEICPIEAPTEIVVETPSIAVSPDIVDATAAETDGTVAITFENLTISDAEDFDVQFYNVEGEETEAPDWILVEVAKDNDDYVLSYIIEANEGDARTTYFKVYAMDGEELVYSNLVAINQAEYVAPGITEQYALFTGNLVEGDYIICYDGRAMNTTVENSRLQYAEVTPEDDVITTDNAAIVWHIAKSGDYWTIYNAEADAYAASTGVKNKAQMLADGTNDMALWEVNGEGEYEFVNKANAEAEINAYLRNNGTYGFACYAAGTGGDLLLYKKVGDTPDPASQTVTVSAAGYATMVATQDLEIPADVEVFAVEINGEWAHLEPITAGIPAGEAVVIKAAEGEYVFNYATETVEALTFTNDLVAATAPVTADGRQYVLANEGDKVGFYRVTERTTIAAGKAYLELPDASGIKVFYFGGESATGINAIDNGQLTIDNAAIYNLNGQRVSKAQKGIYIINGKKVLVK